MPKVMLLLREIKEYLSKWKNVSYSVWKTPYCEDVNSPQLDLQIKCSLDKNPSRVPMGFQGGI